MDIAINNTEETVTIPLDVYERFVAREKAQDIADRKKKAGQDLHTRKDALIVRRVKAQKRESEFCTEEEVLASVDIHKKRKKELVDADEYVKGQTRIEVPDEEIAAYLELEKEGFHYKDITVKDVENKVAEIKAADEQQ